MSLYYEIDWEHPWAPLYGKPIIIPENTIIWRSYDISYPAIGDRFAYYGSRTVAEGYKYNDTRELGHFRLSRPLKLIDYRFMRILLARLIQMNQSDSTIQYLASIMLSFGICSLRHQIKIAKDRYKNLDKTSADYKQISDSIRAMIKYYNKDSIIEQTGVRIAETTNDIYTMGFIQELFKGIFDGFISPRLYSPFHIEKDDSSMSPEMIIFNPQESGITELISYPKQALIKQIRISSLLFTSNNILIDGIIKNGKQMNIHLEYYMCGGGRKRSHYLDEADNNLNMNNSHAVDIFSSGKKMGNKWKKKVNIIITEARPPIAIHEI